MSRRDERGSTTPLVIGFAVIILLVIVAVVDASAAYLRRQSLANLADAAALAAADGVTREQAYVGSVDGPLVDVGAARRYAETYLRQVDAAGRFPGLRSTVAIREGAVVVRVTAPLRLPLAVPDMELPDIAAESAARVVVGQ